MFNYNFLGFRGQIYVTIIFYLFSANKRPVTDAEISE